MNPLIYLPDPYLKNSLHASSIFKANQLLDLDVIAKGLGLQKQSLAALAYMYCETTLSKKWELLSSNWDGPVNQLNQDSIWYAANDALYALKIFESMVVKPSVIPSVFPDFNKGYNGFKKYSRIHETTGKAIRGNYKPKKKSELDASMNDPKTGDKRKSTQGNSGTKKKIEVAIKQKVLFVEK